MSTVTYHVADTRDAMSDMPASSVDLIVTSPPFLALRSYLPADHPDKHREIGSEPTPAAFLDTLLELTAEWRRLLTATGSLCVEFGDTYSGNFPATGTNWCDDPRAPGKTEPPTTDRSGPGWPLAKSLCGIPTLYTWSLAYGRNLLTGQPSPAGQWRIRNLLVWTRPNPPVGALGDKFRPATSYVTVACTSDKRWFDLDAVRTDLKYPAAIRPATCNRNAPGHHTNPTNPDDRMEQNPAGAPPLDWHHDDWQPLHRLPTAPYPGTHYATYPLALPRKLIEAMCPRGVCRTCGEPRRRLTSVDYTPHGERHEEPRGVRGYGVVNGEHAQHMAHGRATTNTTTLGWTDCGCYDTEVFSAPDGDPGIRLTDNYRPGHVLDPFAGSGTTLVAAALTGRDATGIDIDKRNLDLTEARLRHAAHTQGDNPWTVNPELPGLKGEHPDQLNLFDTADPWPCRP